MSQTKYTEATTLTSVVTTELNALADAASALIATELSNDASTERDLFTNVAVTIATQAGARTGGVSLLIVPAGMSAGVYTDAIVDGVSSSYIAQDVNGDPVTWDMDAAVTDRELTWPNVRVPNCNYKVGLLNDSGQALAATGNIVYMSGTFSETYA